MAQTALNVEGTNFVALTKQEDKVLLIQMYKADGEFKPLGDPETFVDEERNEQQWHTMLREDAIKQGHFVPQFSTDPEWNPEPIKEPEIIEQDYLMKTCNLGKGESCCAFLASGAKGFECLKGGSLEHTIRERLAAAAMNAKGDNCDGYNLREKNVDPETT
jgi:hypothetical protein